MADGGAAVSASRVATNPGPAATNAARVAVDPARVASPAAGSRIHVERIVLRGAPVTNLDAVALRSALETQLAAVVGKAALPAGRIVRSGLVIEVGSLPVGPGPLARVVANAVSSAAGGSRRG